MQEKRPASQKDAIDFEDLVYEMVCFQLQDRRSTAQVMRTRAGGDLGRDIIVIAHAPIQLFGIDFIPKENGSIKIYLEVKFTGKPRLSSTHVATNIVNTYGQEFDSFVLVSTMSLPANPLYQMYKILEGQSITFHAVDGERLRRYAEAMDEPWPAHWRDGTPKGEWLGDAVLVDKTVVRHPVGTRIELEIRLALYNRTPDRHYCRVFLQSDTDWSADTTVREVPLAPYAVVPVAFTAVTELRDGRHPLRLGVALGDQVLPIREGVSRLSGDFATQFTGAGHHAAAAAICKALDDVKLVPGGQSRLSILSLSGEAGVGKSRVLHEARRALGGQAEDDRVDTGAISNFCFIDVQIPNTAKPNAVDLAKAAEHQLKIQVPARVVARGLACVVAYLLRPSVQPRRMIPVLVLEDLHNADRRLLRLLSALAQSPRPRRRPFVLMVSGRDDDTHDNTDFLSFANTMKATAEEHPARLALSLAPMSTAEARGLIRSIIRHIPPSGVRRIHALSGNVPANIVQCVQYLLDENLIAIVGRRTVGIVDQLTFERRSDRMPKSMSQVLHARFRRLADVDPALQDAVLAAGFFGGIVPREALSIGLAEADGVEDRLDAVVRTLVDRRFLKELSPDRLAWHHESLLLFVRGELLASEHAARAARKMLSRRTVFERLTPLDQGRVAALAGEHGVASGCWADLLGTVRAIGNFSTADIPTQYFEYIDHAFATVRESGNDPALLIKLLKAKLYIGAYKLSLRHCEKAVAFADQNRRHLDDASGEFDLWKRLLHAHCLMDSGFVGPSQRSFLEVQADLQGMPDLRCDARLQFELHNCLEMLYGYLNHLTLAERYAAAASLWAERSGDPKLPAKELGDRALLYQYVDYERFLELSRRSYLQNRTEGSKRHDLHATLSLFAAELPRFRIDPAWLADVERQTTDILRASRQGAYFSILPRIYLLLAAVTYLRAVQDIGDASAVENWAALGLAARLTDLGINASVRHAVGNTSWQLHNLRAMIHMRQGNETEALRSLHTAVEQIDKEGLLFLGAGDLICPTPVVLANLLKLYRAYHTDKEAAVLLGRVRTYDGTNWSAGKAFEHAMETARVSGTLFTGKRPEALLVDAKTGLGLALWF